MPFSRMILSRHNSVSLRPFGSALFRFHPFILLQIVCFEELRLVSKDFIRIGGAREHNLKNLTLTIPRDKLVVITGLSGSGKSSLAFDTIYAEGQRKYVESLSAYARQFLDQMQKPDVDFIEGLSPAIANDRDLRLLAVVIRACRPAVLSRFGSAHRHADHLGHCR